MGLMDSLENMAAQTMTASGDDHAKVAGGLMEALQEHPGGLGAVLENFKQNGMSEQVGQMQSGESPEMSGEQVQAGLAGTGLVESVAAKAGVSPETAQIVMGKVLPMVMSHFAQHGEAPSGGILGGLLSKFL